MISFLSHTLTLSETVAVITLLGIAFGWYRAFVWAKWSMAEMRKDMKGVRDSLHEKLEAREREIIAIREEVESVREEVVAVTDSHNAHVACFEEYRRGSESLNRELVNRIDRVQSTAQEANNIMYLIAGSLGVTVPQRKA